MSDIGTLQVLLGLMAQQLSTVQIVAVSVIPAVFAITLHEVSHGWVANRLGDPTARMLGRLTANPLKHIDPVGTILVPGFLLLMHLPAFGWAKPVPVTAQNFRDPRKGMAVVAAAGPLSNLLMAFFWALVMKLSMALAGDFSWAGTPLFFMGVVGVFVNLVLMFLNLLPLPPLDGGRVVSGLLPGRLSARYDMIEPYGFIILVGLLITGIIGMIIWPLLNGTSELLLRDIVGISLKG